MAAGNGNKVVLTLLLTVIPTLGTAVGLSYWVANATTGTAVAAVQAGITDGAKERTAANEACIRELEKQTAMLIANTSSLNQNIIEMKQDIREIKAEVKKP